MDRKVKFTSVGFSLGHLVAALLSFAAPVVRCEVLGYTVLHVCHGMRCASKSICEVMTPQDLKGTLPTDTAQNGLASVVPCA
jgi:hypothetical protein